MLTLWELFGGGPWTDHQDRKSIKTWTREFGVEQLDWPVKSPDPNPTEHLWDELEQTLRANINV